MFTVINLDFDQLIDLRIKLFNCYGASFIRNELYEEINYRISYLQSSVERRIANGIDKTDKLDLLKKRKYYADLIEKNTEYLDSLKFSKIRALGDNIYLAKFEAFYIYNKIYQAVILYIDVHLAYHTSVPNSKKTLPKLKPGKSFESTYNFFELLSRHTYKGKNAFCIESKYLEPLLNRLFDFGNTDYDDENLVIPFDINMEGAVWAILFHDLMLENYIESSQKEMMSILAASYNQSQNKKITFYTFRGYFTDTRKRQKLKENKKHIPIDELMALLK